jgi:hypothetical protein
MALTPEQEQQRLELIQEQNKAAKELASTYEKMAKTVGNLNAQDQETLNIAKQISKYSSEIEKSTKRRTDKTVSLVSLYSNLNKQQNNYNNNLETSQKTQDNLNKQIQDSVNIRNNIAASIQQEIIDQQAISNRLTQQEQAYENLLAAKAAGQRVSKIQLDLAKHNLDKTQKEYDVSKKLVSELKEKEKEQNIHITQLEKTKKAHEDILAQQKKEVELTRKALVNNTLDNVAQKLKLDRLRSIEGIYAFIVEAGFKANAQTTQLGKSLGLSYDAADKVRASFAQYTRNSNDAFINTERLVKAQTELTEQLGIAVKFGEEELETFSRLTEIVGLSAQEAGNLTKFSATAGMESRDYVANIRRSAFFAQQANKIHISDKELLSTIGKLSAGILVKFQGNPKAIAEAVVQSKKLGTTLEQVDKTASSLLNFESSIESELEAELITGKQLNFERARAAALTGDQATLMEEMAAQAGSLAEFQGMNVIAQESLAKAFGMSRDEMSEMLIKQEAINKYGDKAAELNAEQIKDMEKQGLSLDAYLAKQAEQQNAQEKFNNAITKLQDIIGNLVGGPFGKLLGMVADLVGMLSTAAGWVAAIGESFGGITGVLIGLIPLLSKASFIARAFALTGFKGAVAAIFRSFAAIPAGLGIPLAIAAVAGLSSLFSSKGDDVFSEGGYGNRTLLTPKGTIKLNNQDTVIAGTNLGLNAGSKSESNAGVIAAISNLTTAMNRPAPAPQFALNVDGQQLGSVVGRQQETGTQQTKNAYRLA